MHKTTVSERLAEWFVHLVGSLVNGVITKGVNARNQLDMVHRPQTVYIEDFEYHYLVMV